MSDCTIVIFGATGDLTKRKLIPSLFRLYQSGLLPQQFAIVGISNIAFEVLAFRNQMIESIKVAFDGEKLDQNQLSQFAERIFYMKGSFENPDTFISLKRELEITETENNLSGNRVYYLAVPPHFFSPIVIQLGKSGLAEESEKQWRRLVIEKPLGHDLNSVRQLAKNIKQSFEEHQIYRIDHYLGKETVQNIIIFRFANGIFEPTWNRRYIDSVQITVAEELGVEHRGSSYDNVGALRDMIPSHLFQVLALVAMEPPASVEAEAVRDEYKKVLNSVVPMKQEDVLMHTVRAQYLNGEIDGEPVVTYRNELDVDKLSDTETYAALRLTIDNWRWSGVPFYLRTGKRLKKRVTEVVIQFKAAPVRLFCKNPIGDIERNQLVLHIQPTEGISLQFGAKVPGIPMEVKNVSMDFKYQDYFGKQLSTGYETLLFDCIMGDATLFRREDQVDLAWQIVTPILNVWNEQKTPQIPYYNSGTWGPKEADDLLARDGRIWRDIQQ